MIFNNVQLLAGDYDKFKEKMNTSGSQGFYIGALGTNTDSSENSMIPLVLFGISGDPGIIYFMIFIDPTSNDNPYAWWYPDNTVTIENEMPSNSQNN